MFQQNVCYTKNNIVLTQIAGCSLLSMIVKTEKTHNVVVQFLP